MMGGQEYTEVLVIGVSEGRFSVEDAISMAYLQGLSNGHSQVLDDPGLLEALREARAGLVSRNRIVELEAGDGA